VKRRQDLNIDRLYCCSWEFVVPENKGLKVSERWRGKMSCEEGNILRFGLEDDGGWGGKVSLFVLID